MPQKVSFHTLGCKLNYSESSTLARHFESGGFERVDPTAESDICVINSCSVTADSDKKCRNLIRRLVRRNPEAIIAVTGCYAQLRPDDIAAIEGVDIVLNNNDKGEMYRRVISLLQQRAEQGDALSHMPEVVSCTTDEITSFFSAFSSGDRTRAFLKVQDGCDYKCSYCTIHYARGASRNAPIAEVVAQAEQIVSLGQREIVITGINTGDFGRSTGERFIDLLRALEEVEGVERYRISSIEPNLLTDEIIELCGASDKFQNHFHIPLQSGSDEVLALMRRRYTSSKFEDRIVSIRGVMPDAFIGIDIIVGFPSESDECFEQSYRLLERLRPAYLHIFPFSERRGTPAVDLPNKISPQVVAERVARLEALNETLHREFVEQAVGRVEEVLFESSVKGGMMFGYTGEYRRVRTPYNKEFVNQVVRVEIDSFDPDSAELIGNII